MTRKSVLQFKVNLLGSRPNIWRRIQLVDSCTFWDLHVAIQDAMGWLDTHLHCFHMIDSSTGKNTIMGIPDDEGFDVYTTLPGWKYKVLDCLGNNDTFHYEYDFGDGWEHTIVYEGKHNKEPLLSYPVCLAGEQACPPEDVGGIHGYYEFVDIIKNPNHEEHERILEWVGGGYDPNHFDPDEVTFENPKKRYNLSFHT